MLRSYHAGLNPVGPYQGWNRIGSLGVIQVNLVSFVRVKWVSSAYKYLGLTQILHLDW